MQNEQKKGSKAESVQKEKDSVYDFLYHDAPRIASFLSQFDPSGHLKTLSLSDSDSSGSNYGSSAKISATAHASAEIPYIAEGDINAQGGVDGNMSFKTNNETTSSRTYDPHWQNALAFLDYLEQKELLNRNIFKSNIGQFVLLTGKLFMFDIGFIQKVLQKPTSKQRFINGFVKAADSNKDTAKGDANETQELITALPNSIQSRLIGEGFTTWSTLHAHGLSLSSDDLVLKHGFSIAGEWKILGILDALPDPGNINIDHSCLPQFQKLLADYSATIRPRFGRDSDSFGLTPLLLFREVS